MLKKILFATVLVVGFSASFSVGGAGALFKRVELIQKVGACHPQQCDILCCNPDVCGMCP